MKRSILIVVAFAVVVVIAFIAGALLHGPDEERAGAPLAQSPGANAPASNSGSFSTEHAAGHTGPVEGADRARAQRLFKANCVTCHLESGKGDPHHRKDGIPDFTDATWHARKTDAELISAVENGTGKVMPAFKGKLLREEITLLVHYLRDLPKRAAATSKASAREPKTLPATKAAPKPKEDHSGHGDQP
jgi:mono/diheme cytochrome c family protein